MANDSKAALAAGIIYGWNPFQDIAANRVVNETVTVQGGAKGNIIVPRKGPFFSRNFKIKMKTSGRELSMERGEYSFVHPFGAFIEKYSRLTWGALQVKGVASPTDFVIEYDTIGGGFVLDDIAYAKAVADVLTSARTADWSQIVNLPSEFPPDPHDHPASDTFNYGDLMVWLKSYLDAITGTETSFTVAAQLEAHLKAELQQAHKATLKDLGVNNLKDWAMATEDDLVGNSTELLVNVHFMKEAIRSFQRGEWR